VCASVGGRIGAALDHARSHGSRMGDDPPRWRGHLKNFLPARGKVAKVERHAALPWKGAAAVIAALRAKEGVAARALQVVVLTAARTGEPLGARWPEIDRDRPVWTVPGGA
jgi:integrase